MLNDDHPFFECLKYDHELDIQEKISFDLQQFNANNTKDKLDKDMKLSTLSIYFSLIYFQTCKKNSNFKLKRSTHIKFSFLQLSHNPDHKCQLPYRL